MEFLEHLSGEDGRGGGVDHYSYVREKTKQYDRFVEVFDRLHQLQSLRSAGGGANGEAERIQSGIYHPGGLG